MITLSERTRMALDALRHTVSREINEGTNLQRYQSDMMIDTESVITNEGMPFVWSVGPTGTHMCPLSAPRHDGDWQSVEQFVQSVNDCWPHNRWYVWTGEPYQHPKRGWSELTPIGSSADMQTWLTTARGTRLELFTLTTMRQPATDRETVRIN